MEEVKLDILTDEAILDYTTDPDGRQRVLTDWHDFHLKFGYINPYIGGVYDASIFGSPLADRCVCGYIRGVSMEPCPRCGARVYPVEEGLRRFARIELPFYYLNELRFDIFKDLFDDIFKDTTITLKFTSGNLKAGGYGYKNTSKKLGIKVFDSCQFEYHPKQKELIISEMITDEDKCSYEGLLKILEKHFPDRLSDMKRLINRLYLIQPAMMRPFVFTVQNGKKKLVPHRISMWYSVVISLMVPEATDANPVNYDDVMEQLTEPGERVRYRALLKAFLNAGRKETTELLNASKENLAREIYSARINNSARCAITPDVNLAIDEVSVPRHIAYEMCRSAFCKYLQKELNFTNEQAIRSTREEYNNPKIQELFKEFAEDQVVLINRQPTLHEYGFLAMKLRLNDEEVYDPTTDREREGNIFTIGLPQAVCEPLNADFDGDTVSIYLVDKEVQEDTYQKLSPRYITHYHKTNELIYHPTHEVLNGLNELSEVRPDQPEDIEDPKENYTDWKTMVVDAEVKKTLPTGRPVMFTGKIGSETYDHKITTYGRLKISKVIDADLDLIHIDEPLKPINGKSGVKLYEYVLSKDNGPETIKELQRIALQEVTKSGVVTFNFDNLRVPTNTETYKRLRAIVDDPELTDKDKLLRVTDLYEKYSEEIRKEFREDLKKEINRAGRVKLTSLSDMNTPQLIISGVDEKVNINHGSLLEGLSEKEYQVHAIENRSLQSIKQMGVPSSGMAYYRHI